MRERVEQSTQKAEEATTKESLRKLRQPDVDPTDTPKRKIPAPLRVIWQPIGWILRHIIPRYFKSAYHELRLTTWPNRKQSRQLTIAVVLFAVVFGVFVWVLDYGLDKVFKELFVK